MKTAASGVKLTYDDFLLFPDDGMRHELIDGEHYVSPSPNIRHQGISGSLYLLLGAWLEAHPGGRVFYAPLDVIFSMFDVVEPDLLYLSAARAAEAMKGDFVQVVPDLVIEILSKGTRKRDETIKRQLYERTGVTEYWIVNPESESIRVHSRAGARFASAVELSREGGDILTTALLPGLEMPLSRIFRE
ncbi:MAG: Uma2 family endonuclease [Acidobacteriota bacterium]